MQSVFITCKECVKHVPTSRSLEPLNNTYHIIRKLIWWAKTVSYELNWAAIEGNLPIKESDCKINFKEQTLTDFFYFSKNIWQLETTHDKQMHAPVCKGGGYQEGDIRRGISDDIYLSGSGGSLLIETVLDLFQSKSQFRHHLLCLYQKVK